ncbi:CatB-related O-acetyltransferase [Labrys wisconsinensis]|uniref:Acetyltransferase-like isoleucine patch superfamily enzyme n=1 Tax=Labrys wisconsinensis TaxID=425677 RepID=A0ABU0JCT5_9HYPH|nr:CatB-related O-acetyltransferase [Labrys wisconsinensis]MDQ0471059.1 acetyltransferase-like isoleucine patch superfamily enzyme [Labrys wisconsinensis]
MDDDQKRFSLIAPTAEIRDQVVIEHPIRIHNFVEIHSNVKIGGFCALNASVCIHGNVTIGRYSAFGRNADVGVGHHPLDWLTTHAFTVSAGHFPSHPDYWGARRRPWNFLPDTHIGSDVWVGAQSVIRAGIRVGDGAVIAAGAVVIQDVPAYAVVAGVPSRIIRFRFPDDIIRDLLDVRWWELPLREINDLPFDDVQACIGRLRAMRAARLPRGDDPTTAVE